MSGLLRDLRSPGWPADDGVVVVFLHGFGSDEHDLAGLAPALELAVPWASLRAPLELGNGGAAWFGFTPQGTVEPGPVAEATRKAWAWIEEYTAPATRVVPIGFSQGGLVATQLLRTCPERVLAPVVLGGFVLGAPQPADAALALSRPALFWGRGLEDRVISPAAVEHADEWFSTHTSLTSRAYPGLAHAVSADELADLGSFLAAQLPPRTLPRPT